MPSWFADLSDKGSLANVMVQWLAIGLLVLAIVLAIRANTMTRKRIGREPNWRDLLRSRTFKPVFGILILYVLVSWLPLISKALRPERDASNVQENPDRQPR